MKKLGHMFMGFVLVWIISVAAVGQADGGDNSLAIVGVTVIDGNGGTPLPDATVVVGDGKILALGSAAAVTVPADARVIDGRGHYLLPGIVDSNVHASVYGNARRRETVVKYGHRNEELALEFVQRQLKHGVTTIRDSYGDLTALMAVRDRIETGEAIGPRMMVAGNIVGWGGPFSLTFSLIPENQLTVFQAKWNDRIAQGVGEELMDMGPEELSAAIHAYIDKGPNFIKFGGTSHFRFPSLIGFSEQAQEAIVKAAHDRGLIAETHATSPEGLRMAVGAGIDLIQHPEILSRDYPEDLIQMVVEKDVICGMRSNVLTGNFWQDHLQARERAIESQKGLPAPVTSAERRSREDQREEYLQIQRRNAERLIKAGCTVSIATDNYQGDAPEFRRSPKPIYQEAGIGSILAVEGLVELGMSEMEAIVAGTKNGAIATGRQEEFGTVEVGKSADLILLSADPLKDISNIRSLEMVIMRGTVIDTDRLPEVPIFSKVD